MEIFSIFLNKLLNIDPISAVSIAFTILVMLSYRHSIKLLKESYDISIKHIQLSYNETTKVLKEIIDKNNKDRGE